MLTCKKLAGSAHKWWNLAISKITHACARAYIRARISRERHVASRKLIPRLKGLAEYYTTHQKAFQYGFGRLTYNAPKLDQKIKFKVITLMFQGGFSKFWSFRTRDIMGFATIPHSTPNSKKKICARIARAHIFARAQNFWKRKILSLRIFISFLINPHSSKSVEPFLRYTRERTN